MTDLSFPVPTRASFQQGVQWAWDSTSIKAALKCPRYYQYKIMEGWESPGTSVHLWFGGILATVLEHFHKRIAEGVSYEEAQREAALETLVLSWDHELDAEGNRIEGTGAAHTTDINTKTRETLFRSVIWYLFNYENDYYKTFVTQEGKSAVEHSFQLPVDNGITLCGHIDRLCVDPEDNIFVHDQKTTASTIGPYWFEGFKPDAQFSLYTLAGKMLYKAPVKGVMVDGIQVVVGFTRFARAPIMHTDDELEEFYEETMHLIETTNTQVRNGYLPRRTTSCSNYGGCEFRRVCSRPRSVRPNFLAGDFHQSAGWDPITPR
jgi:hypothetical protein